MGRNLSSPWYFLYTSCVLGVAWLYIGVSANITFATGLAPRMHANHSIKDKLYLQILKEKIQREIEKRRGNITDEPMSAEAEEEIIQKEHDENPKSQFVIADPLGKNLLQFTIKKNTGELRESQVSRVNLWIHVWQKERKRKRQTRKKRKGKMIRIGVYNNSSKGDATVAELRTRIQSTKWFRISLPISLVRNLETSGNDTLVLRVECKRCNKRTRLMLPQNSNGKCKKNKRKRKKKRKNRKQNQKRRPKSLGNYKRNCGTARNTSIASQRRPFMVIEQRFRSFDRRKRSLTCNPADLFYRNGTLTSARCCRISTYVEFSDMDLDDYIVTPGGYQASRCVGRCPRVRRNRNRSSRRRRVRNRNQSRERRGSI